MQLNHDCMRDLLLYLEDQTGVYKDPETDKFDLFEVSTAQLFAEENLTTKYEPDTIVYTLLKLIEAKMLMGNKVVPAGNSFCHIVVTDITWEGHEFLGHIRDNTTWKKVKDTSVKLGVSSVKGLATMAWQLFLVAVENIGKV